MSAMWLLTRIEEKLFSGASRRGGDGKSPAFLGAERAKIAGSIDVK